MDVFNSLKLREGMPKDELLLDMIADCTQDLKEMLHRELGEEDTSLLKEMVLVKINHDGIEGIQSESHSGNTTTYLDDIPQSLKRKIREKRKLVR